MGINHTGIVFILIFAYFLGAIPFGLIIGKKFFSLDIREHGSKNLGATNVWRTLGPKAGIITLLLDMLKGAIPVITALTIFPGQELIAMGAGIAAIFGHNWSVFLDLRGGKGVATSAGVFLALVPLQMAIALLVFLLTLAISKHVSVGSMVAALSLMTLTFVFPTSSLLRIVIVIAGILILFKHIPNMKRLAQGTEPRVKFR